VTATPVGIRATTSATLPWMITALTLLAVALVLCGEALAASAVPIHAVVWGSLALAAYSAGLLFLTRAREGDLGLARWKIGPWIVLWYGISFGLASLTWIQPQISITAQITVSSVLRALWLIAVGMTFLVIGYLVGPGHPARRLAARGIGTVEGRFSDAVRSPFAPWALYALGVAGRIASAVTTGVFGYVGDAASAVSTASGYGQFLSALSLLAPLAVCAAALQVYRERSRGARFTLAVLFLTELAFGAAAGGKEDFVIAVLAVVIPMSAARRRLPKVAIIGCVLLFLGVVIPFNQAYRAAVRSSSATLTPSQAVHQAPAILRQTLTGQSLITLMPSSTLYLLQRIREIDSPAIIMQRTPAQIPFSSPAQLVEAPVADVVPRAIWSGKPILATGYQFSQQYYGLPNTLYTSSAITPVGDLYRHGGWIPVIVGMFAFGCGVRLLDDALDVRANPHAIFLILLLLPSLVLGEQDWVTLMASIPATVLVWLSAVAFTFRPRRST
jgi:hypothetical protein